MKEKVKYESQC